MCFNIVTSRVFDNEVDPCIGGFANCEVAFTETFLVYMKVHESVIRAHAIAFRKHLI